MNIAIPSSIRIRGGYTLLDVALAGVVAILLGACGSQPPPSAPSPTPSLALTPGGAPVPAIVWLLEEGTFRGQPIPLVAGHPITVEVGISRLNGIAACNGYTVFFERLNGNVHFESAAAGAQDCAPLYGPEVMVSEEAFLSAIPTMTRIDDSRADSLVIEGPELELRFVPSPSP